MVIQQSWIHSIFRSQRDRKHRKCFEWKRFFMKQTLIVKEECLMMRMLEEMTGFDFFWHHHVSNFRGATLDNGEENNYCLDSNIKSKHFSPVISCSRSFKSLLVRCPKWLFCKFNILEFKRRVEQGNQRMFIILK